MNSRDPQAEAARLAELEFRLAALENEVAHLRERMSPGVSPVASPATRIESPKANPIPTAETASGELDKRWKAFGATPDVTPRREVDQTAASAVPVMSAATAVVPTALPVAPAAAPPTSPAVVPAIPPVVAGGGASGGVGNESLGTQLRALQEQRRAGAESAPAATAVAPLKKPVPSAARKKSSGMSGLEQALGGRWYALIGAVIVLIGIGLFFKLAIDNKWFTVSPLMRCIGVAIAGFGMLGAGEWALRKLTRAASAGFSAAGIGMLIGSVWAAHRLYGLTNPAVAFVLMGVACAIGVGISARSGLASVAAASLIGAYLNPIIVGDSDQSKIGFFAYLLMVLATGLALPVWKGRAFVGVRSVVWWGTLLMGGFTALSEIVRPEPTAPLVFVTLAWFMIQGELGISAGRFGLVEPRSAAEQKSPNLRAILNEKLSGETVAAGVRAWRPIMSSFSTTVWAAVIATFALQHMAIPTWLGPAFFAAITLMGAQVLSGHLRFLTDAPESDAERIGVSLAVQAGALVIAAVSMALSGGVQVVAWLAMGGAAIAGGRWMRSRPLDVYGLTVLTLGTVRLVVWDSHHGIGTVKISEALGLVWGPWMLLAIGAAAAWGFAAWLLRREASECWKVVSNTAAAIAVTIAGLGLTLQSGATSSAMIVAAITAVGLGFLAEKLRAKGIGAFTLVVLGLVSLLPFARVAAIGTGPSMRFSGLVLSDWTLAVVGIAIAWGAAARFLRSGHGLGWVVASNVAVAICLTMAGLGLTMFSKVSPASVVVLGLVGVGLSLTAVKLKSQGIGVYALVVLGIAMLMPPGAGAWVIRDGSPFAGLVITRWMGVLLAIGGMWVVLRVFLPRVLPDKGPIEYICSCGMYTALMFAFVHGDASAGSIAIAWLVVAVGGAVIGDRTAWKDLLLPASGVLGLAVMAWLAGYSPLRGSWEAGEAPAMLSAGLWTGLALAAGAGVMARLVGRDAWRFELKARAARIGIQAALVVVGVSLLWIASSMEAGRIGEIISNDRTVQRAAVSVWWGLFGLGLISAGFMWRTADGRGVPVARRAGLALVAIAVLKALIWDLVQVPALARVVSFVGLGLLMMAVTVVYAKLAGRLEKKSSDDAGPAGAAEDVDDGVDGQVGDASGGPDLQPNEGVVPEQR
ncbi:MAG: DUF2339 domain-containing protein [Phycisphaerales bacterium]|nr:DUF2339 domain-containing protein [Phycisphaerales bacterium]